MTSSPQYFISKKVGKAIADYDMIQDGDKILVAVSGGKDSLSLLKILRDRLSFVPIDYKIKAVYVDLGINNGFANTLECYFRKNKYDYLIKKEDISSSKDKSDKDFSCFWCSWNRRRVLFQTATDTGCNKIALGHNKDDIAQTFLMNVFFAGEISTMVPKQKMFEGRFDIIRPLAYVEEKELEHLARKCQFPVAEQSCPNHRKNNRRLMAKIIDSAEKVSPDVKTNLLRCTKRIKEEYLF